MAARHKAPSITEHTIDTTPCYAMGAGGDRLSRALVMFEG